MTLAAEEDKMSAALRLSSITLGMVNMQLCVAAVDGTTRGLLSGALTSLCPSAIVPSASVAVPTEREDDLLE